MKKPIRILNLLVALGMTASFALSSAACTSDDGSLAAPVGFRVDEENELTWEEVEDARSYIIEIYSVDTNERKEETARRESYSLSGLAEGDYEIRIRAQGGRDNTLLSEWSEVYSFHKDYETGCVYRLINNDSEYEIYDVGSAGGTVMIEDVYRGKPVTQIADRAFGSSRIENITLGNNVRSIGIGAFSNCSYLVSVTIPDSVTQIGESAFQKCTSLTSVSLPEGLTELSSGLFSYCSSLKEVEFGPSVKTIGELAFYQAGLAVAEIPDSVTEIGENAFAQSQISGAVIGAGVETIDDYAFYKCENLASVSFSPAGALQEIGNYAFYGCPLIVSMEIPEGTLSLGDYSFASSSALEGITIPESLSSMGVNAFSATALYDNQASSGYIYAGKWLSAVTDTLRGSVTSIKADMLRADTVGIADYALSYCDHLESAAIPASVRWLGKHSFAGNKAMKSFYGTGGDLEAIGDYAFYQCEVLSNAQFGDKLRTIGSYAFRYCAMLNNNTFSNLLVPDSVTKIGTYAFNDTGLWNNPDDSGVVYAGDWVVGYNNLTNNVVTLSEDVVGVADYAFYMCDAVENINGLNRASYIGRGAFYGCNRLASVRLNRNLESIGEYTFYCCYSLFSIGEMPSGLSSIGRYAFYRCELLGSLDLSESEVTSIGSHAFYGCANLSELQLGDFVTTVDDYAFYGCSALETVELPDTVTSLGERAFGLCSALKSVHFGTGLRSIGQYAFRECTALESADIPGNVETIGDYAFYKSGLTSLTLGEGIKEIGDYAFYGCSGIREVLLPQSVRSVGDYAFRSCGQLTSVILRGELTYVGKHAFYGCNSLTFYVAGGQESAEGWNPSWNSTYRPVVWGCALSADGTYVLSVTAGEGTVENIYAQGGLSSPGREGYVFVGWALRAGASEADYDMHGLASVPAGTTVYAVWEKAPEQPSGEDAQPGTDTATDAGTVDSSAAA